MRAKKQIPQCVRDDNHVSGITYFDGAGFK